MSHWDKETESSAPANKPVPPTSTEVAQLTWFRETDKAVREPSEPPKRWQPKIRRNMSPEQRIVSSQTKNPIRAIYTPESEWNQTPELPEGAETTREVGPGDKYNRNYRAGKATTEPTESNKTRYPGRRTYGGGTNRQRINVDELVEKLSDLF